jgi:hypothetical protein
VRKEKRKNLSYNGTVTIWRISCQRRRSMLAYKGSCSKNYFQRGGGAKV